LITADELLTSMSPQTALSAVQLNSTGSGLTWNGGNVTGILVIGGGVVTILPSSDFGGSALLTSISSQTAISAVQLNSTGSGLSWNGGSVTGMPMIGVGAGTILPSSDFGGSALLSSISSQTALSTVQLNSTGSGLTWNGGNVTGIPVIGGGVGTILPSSDFGGSALLTSISSQTALSAVQPSPNGLIWNGGSVTGMPMIGGGAGTILPSSDSGGSVRSFDPRR
jgi:hypothetical protein